MSDMFYCSFVGEHFIICECGETFPTEELLKEHFNKHHRNVTERTAYKCRSCGKIFTTQKACSYHYEQTHLEDDTEDEEDEEVVKETPKEKKKYVNLKNIVCEVCGKRYASNAALRYHQRVHTGERPYQCSECPKSFTMPLFLQIHIRTHTGEKPYECQHCPKAFSNKAALLRHDRVHTGVKPYECPKCGKTFTQSNSMKLHVNTVHLKMPAPYKSKNRKNKVKTSKIQQPSNIEVDIQNNIHLEEVEIHLEEDIEGMQEQVVEETQLSIKPELYQEEVFYGTMKDGEVLYVDGIKSEILYEEVYEG